MSKNIVDELLKSLNVSISKTRLDKNLVARNLTCKNNSIMLDNVSLNKRDLKKLINLCMTEGDMVKMKIIGDYIINHDKEVISTLNVYEVVSLNSMDCLCIYAKQNLKNDEFLLNILIEAMIETQSDETIIAFIKEAKLNTKCMEDLILQTEKASLILAYVTSIETDILKFQNKLINIANKDKNPEFLIKFYLAKKPNFFTNIEDTLMKLKYNDTNIDLLLEYLEVNTNARKKLFDTKFNNIIDSGLKRYYFSVMNDITPEEVENEDFFNRFKECKYIDKCKKSSVKELRKI